MNTDIVTELRVPLSTALSPFRRWSADSSKTGVEYYHVDYVALQKRFYSATGDVVTTPIPTRVYLPSPPISIRPGYAPRFSTASATASITRDFTRRAMEGPGVQGYIAFLRGLRVTYWGRGGDQHTEWFPGQARLTPNDRNA